MKNNTPAFLFAAMLCACFQVCGREKEEKELQILHAPWENPTGVARKFETPGGAVYVFPNSLSNSVLNYVRERNRRKKTMFHVDTSCKCQDCVNRRQHYALEVSIPPPKKARNMRFVGMEFFCRKFPASQKDWRSSFAFTISFSPNTAIDGDLANVSGILEKPTGGLWYFYDEACRVPGDSQMIWKNVPDFEFGWNHYRIVFDTGARIVTVFANGNVEFIKPLKSIKGSNFNVNSVSFSVDKYSLSTMPLLEVSDPIFYRFSEFKELSTLPPVAYRNYPYDSYDLSQSKKGYIRKNPDATYAAAMRMLRNSQLLQPAEAVGLLEKAASDDHVFALYELGVCYAYGVGVRQNLEKARQYFQKAVKKGYEDEAQCTQFLLLWQQEPEHIFLDEKLLKMYQDCRDANNGSSYAAYFLSFANFDNYGSKEEAVKDRIVFQNEKLISGWRESIDRITASAMVEERVTDSDDPGIWYITQLKRYMRAGYAPAFFRFAELWKRLAQIAPPDQRNDYLTRARLVLQQGADIGDDFCRLEFLITSLMLDQLKPDTLTIQDDIRFHRNPRYYLLKYLLSHPNEKWKAPFLQGEYATALKVANQTSTPEQKYVQGLLLLAPYFTEMGSYGKVKTKLTSKDQGQMYLETVKASEGWVDAIAGYNLIEEAAEAGVPEAKFLIGTLYLVTPEKTVQLVRWNIDKSKGVKFLSELDPAKWPLASYYLAEHAFTKTKLNTKIADWEKRLQPTCQLNFAPAWYLLGKVYEYYNFKPKAEAAYLKAGDSGMLLGYSTVACLMDESKRDSRALWAKFQKAHLEERRQNRYDPYSANTVVVWPKSFFPPKTLYPLDGIIR